MEQVTNSGAEAPRKDILSELSDFFAGEVLSRLGDAVNGRETVLLPVNPALEPQSISGTVYTGLNAVLGNCALSRNGFQTPFFGTFDAWKARGLFVRGGEHGTLMTRWSTYFRDVATGRQSVRVKTDADYDALSEEEKKGVERRSYIKSFRVFNADQISYESASHPEKNESLQLIYQNLLAASGKRGSAMQDNIARCEVIDRAIASGDGPCPVFTVNEVVSPRYDVMRDAVIVPDMTYFFKNEQFYGAILDAWADKLSRKYLEEHPLDIASLPDASKIRISSTFAGAVAMGALGLQKTVDTNDLAEIRLWMNAIGEKPGFVLQVMRRSTSLVGKLLKEIGIEPSKGIDLSKVLPPEIQRPVLKRPGGPKM